MEKEVQEVEEEVKKEEELKKYMVRHNSNIRMRWDLLVITFTLYNCVNIPFSVAFADKMKENLAVTIVDRVIDACFVFDILLNFRTTYINLKTSTEII